MTRFETGNICFSFRFAGVMLHDGCVLLRGEPRGVFWTLPGGGVELLEPSEEALFPSRSLARACGARLF